MWRRITSSQFVFAKGTVALWADRGSVFAKLAVFLGDKCFYTSTSLVSGLLFQRLNQRRWTR